MPIELSHRASAVVQAGETPRVRTEDGALEQALITPEGLGGRGGQGTSAEALLAAGYAACFHAALGYAAARRGETLPADAQVTASVEVTGGGEEGRFEADIVVDAALPSMEAEAARGLIEAAQEVWPYAAGAQPIAVRLAGGETVQGSQPAQQSGRHEQMEARAEAAEGRGYGG